VPKAFFQREVGLDQLKIFPFHSFEGSADEGEMVISARGALGHCLYQRTLF
jgi:hypothetical protein